MGALIWLASYPKSGNTWMRSFLHNLLTDAREPADINELDQFCVGESGIGWYQRHTETPLDRLTLEELARIRPLAQADLTRVHPDSVFVKTHNFLGGSFGQPLHNMDVTAGAIYIVRNPLDVVLSVTNHFGITVDEAIAQLASPTTGTALTDLHVPEFHSSWSIHVESWTGAPNPNLLVLRYEDLLAEPRRYFGRVAKFLGLRPPEERLARAIRNSSFKILKEQEQRKGFKERSELAQAFFREGRKDQWREKLTPEQVRRIIADHHVQMARFGYIPRDFRDAVPAAHQTKITRG